MAPHSSTLAWKILWTEEPNRLQSMGCSKSDRTERLHFHFSPSCIREGNGNPLQCSSLENPRDGGAWWAFISRVTQSRIQLKQLSSSSSKHLLGASLVAQMAENLPAMQEIQVQFLGQEDPWRRGWLPTPVFLPGKPHGQRRLASCSPWGCKELDTTERLTHTHTILPSRHLPSGPCSADP